MKALRQRNPLGIMCGLISLLTRCIATLQAPQMWHIPKRGQRAVSRCTDRRVRVSEPQIESFPWEPQREIDHRTDFNTDQCDPISHPFILPLLQARPATSRHQFYPDSTTTSPLNPRMPPSPSQRLHKLRGPATRSARCTATTMETPTCFAAVIQNARTRRSVAGMTSDVTTMERMPRRRRCIGAR